MPDSLDSTVVRDMSIEDIRSLPENKVMQQKEVSEEEVSASYSSLLMSIDPKEFEVKKSLAEGLRNYFDSKESFNILGKIESKEALNNDRAILSSGLFNNPVGIINPFDTNSNIKLEEYDKYTPEEGISSMFSVLVLYGVRNYWNERLSVNDFTLEDHSEISAYYMDKVFPGLSNEDDEYTEFVQSACRIAFASVVGFVNYQDAIAKLGEDSLSVLAHYDESTKEHKGYDLEEVIQQFMYDLYEERSVFVSGNYTRVFEDFRSLIFKYALPYSDTKSMLPEDKEKRRMFEMFINCVRDISESKFEFSKSNTDRIHFWDKYIREGHKLSYLNDEVVRRESK